MKRWLFAAALLSAAVLMLSGCGEKEAGPGAYVTVIGPEGPAVQAQFVEFCDYDGNGTCDIDEVLRAAHKEYNENGEDAYGSADGDFGRCLTKLWGDESGAYGYYLNNEPAMNLAEPVNADDYVVAFVYQDQETWSDVYAFFDRCTAESGEITLTLSIAGYDENWNPTVSPAEGAVILVDGVPTQHATDAEGRVIVTLDDGKTHTVTASLDGYVLVTPVCIVGAERS